MPDPRRWLLPLLLLFSAMPATAQAPVLPPEAADKVVRILRTTNLAQTNRYVCEALEFRNVNPYNLINFFWAAVMREEGGIYSFVHPTEERGYLVVICPEYQLPSLRELAARLDRPRLHSGPGSRYIYYRMRHRNAANPAFLATASFYLGDSGTLIPDIETNSVQIFDAPAGAVAMETAFRDILDQPLPQVEVAVRIYEVDVNNDARLGLDYQAWKNGPGRLLAGRARTAEVLNMDNARPVRSNAAGGGVYLNYPSAFFDFLVVKGKARVLSEANVSAIHRAPALVTAGEQISYLAVDETAGVRTVEEKTGPAAVAGLVFPSTGDLVAGGNIRLPWRTPAVDGQHPIRQFPQQNRAIDSRIASVETGISLAVVPTIGRESVTLELDLSVVNHLGYDGRGVPLLGSRQMRESISVAAGQEVIFGGLMRERQIQQTRKMPILGSLPVIGYLFGGETSTQQRTLVVAALTPKPVVGASNMTEAALGTMRRAAGDDAIVLPRTEFMFEQNFGRTAQ